MVVKSMKYLAILFSYIMSHDLLITWHRYVNTWHLIHDTWYLTPDTWYAITWYWVFDKYTWYSHLILDMLSLGTDTLDLMLWHLTGYYHTDTCITLPIHDYRLYRDLTWLLYCYQISSTPELLYSWTPEIGRLLILYSWYYIPVGPRNWLIMDIGLL